VLKKYFLFIFLLFAAITSRAQYDYTSYNYTQYAVGVGASYIRGYTNLNQQDNHTSQSATFTYYYTGYIPLTAEIQSGTLSGGNLITDASNRFYINHYIALIFHGDFQLGQIMDDNEGVFLDFMKNFYAGTGFGFVANNNKVQRIAISDPTYVFPGKDQSINLMVPIRAGYEYKFYNRYNEPSVRIYAEYEHNLVFGEGLDGYDDPPNHFKNNNLNQYRQISIGIKYDFGPTTGRR
jgi:hypothetical protein